MVFCGTLYVNVGTFVGCHLPKSLLADFGAAATNRRCMTTHACPKAKGQGSRFTGERGREREREREREIRLMAS